jgi:hypothetical protein
MDHDYTDEQKAFDGGLMDKFVQATSDVGVGCRPDGSTVMAYFDGNTVTALWNYAQRFAMDDNSHGSMFGPSTVGALNLVSGQTGHAVIALTFSNGTIATTSPLVTITGDSDRALDDCEADMGDTKTGQGTLEIPQGKNVGDLLNVKDITWGWFQGGFAPTKAATRGSPAVCGAMHIQHQYTPPEHRSPSWWCRTRLRKTAARPISTPRQQITCRITSRFNTIPRPATRTICARRPIRPGKSATAIRPTINTISPTSLTRCGSAICR